VPAVVVVVALFVLLACSGAIISCRLRSAVGVALDVFSLVHGLQIAYVASVWCSCSCDGGCRCALLHAWCSVLIIALRALHRCPRRCL
jgi:hypothetical protein